MQSVRLIFLADLSFHDFYENVSLAEADGNTQTHIPTVINAMSKVGRMAFPDDDRRSRTTAHGVKTTLLA
jgi:hypothetical protein